MTRDRARELLPVIQAYAEGKEIQYRKDESDSWRDVGIGRLGGLMDINMEFDCQWRVKPEPRVWWCGINNHDAIIFNCGSEIRAQHELAQYPNVPIRIIKVQEVL